MKDKFKIVSSIDIGSYNIRMVIAQINTQGDIKILEELRHHANIGKDTFSYGKVNVDTIQETCIILKKYSRLMKEYNVKHYKAVTTSGIREASNRSYIIDQIKMKTGLEVEIINNAEERFLTFKAIRDKLKNVKGIREEGSLIVNIGSGGVEISAYKDGNLRFTSYIKVGSLRLREMLSDIERVTLDFPQIMEEFIESKTYLIEPVIKDMKIKNFIGLGGGLRNIVNLCNIDNNENTAKVIKKDFLDKLYLDISRKSIEKVASTYSLDYSEAQTLLPATIIFNKFLSITEANGIYVPMVSLRHGILAEMVDNWYNTPRKKDFLNDIISSVKFIGKKFDYDEEHATHVQYLSTLIFDYLRRIHKLGDRERLYLQVASLLHDIGKFINLDKHHIYSYGIIKALNIMGFSNRELSIIANIVRYHSDENPNRIDKGYNRLDYNDQITVSKLCSILKLSDAMDIAHTQKVRNLDITYDSNNIYIKVQTKDDIILEKWTFMKNAEFFEEVFGMKVIIKHKG